MSGSIGEPTDARQFRRRLDEVLRQRSPQAMRDFLLASGQWQEGNVPADLDRAMWMMIAASPALADLRDEAERWLVARGFAHEARAILGRGGAGGASRPPAHPAGHPGGKPGASGRAADTESRERQGRGSSQGAANRPGQPGANRPGESNARRREHAPPESRNGHRPPPRGRPPQDRHGERGDKGGQR
jgi:hypothetical protein